METLSFQIEGKPIPASRPRIMKNGGRTYTKSHLEYKARLASVLPSFNDVVPKAPVEVALQFVFPRYATSDHPTYRADLDNLSKIVLDTMTDCAFWQDDNLIVGLKATKRFTIGDEQPHTKVTISPVEDPEVYSEGQYALTKH